MQRRTVGALVALAAVLGVAFAVGVTTLQAKPRTADAWIGVGVRDLDRDELETLALVPGTQGVVVTRVLDDSPAAAAGVQPGDVITHLGSHSMRRARDFVRAVQRETPGETVELRLQRDGKEKRLTVKLAAEPDDDVAVHVAPFRLPHKLQTFVNVTGVQLGIHGIDLDDRDLAAYFGVKPEGGILVTDVVEGSGAAAAGIRGGDVVLAVAGEPVPRLDALRETLRDHADGDTVEVRLRRQQREQSVQVVLDSDANELSLFTGRHPHGRLQWFDDNEGLQRELDALRRDLDALRQELRQEKR